MKAQSYFLIVLALLAFTLNSYSQDIIILKSGDEIKSKVLEINSSDIKYKKYDNQSGPTYTIEKVKVLMIRYENGDKDIFDETEKSDQNPLPNSALSLNLLGVIQFGPIIQYEFSVSDNLYLYPSLRIGYLGYLFHVAWDVTSSDSDYLNSPCLGIGLGVRGFSPNPSGGAVYYGGLIEYNTAKAVWSDGETYETYEKYSGLALLGNFGYRWRYESGMFLNVGIYGGPNITLSDKEYNKSDDSLKDEYSEMRFIGFLELSFGWEF